MRGLVGCRQASEWRLTDGILCDAFVKSDAGLEALRRFSPKRRRVAIQCNFLRNFESFLIWFGHPQRSWNTHSWHFEILILNLSSSRFFLATILKCFNLKSSHCFLRVRHNEFVYIIFYMSMDVPPSLNNYPYWTAASSTFHSRTFSNLRVAVMLQRWFCRLKFCLNPMDTYYFAYLSLTSTQLYILAMTFWARVRCGSKHHLIFFACSPRVDTFLDLQRFSSETSPIILVNRSCALHFFDKGFNRALNEWVSGLAFC